MSGALRLDRTLWLRRSRSLGGTGCYRPAFVSLSHGSRSFHHKTRPVAPPSYSLLENFRAATAFSTLNSSICYSALIGLHLRIASILTNGRRFYSRSSALPSMAEVQWTGPRVRKTFLDFFAERGHSIGKAPSPASRAACPRSCSALHDVLWHYFQTATMHIFSSFFEPR
jgi:alanyl-tRNA synthetase